MHAPNGLHVLFSISARIQKWLIVLLLIVTGCSQAGLRNPCTTASPARRRAGQSVVRQRIDNSVALVFVQGLFGSDPVTSEHFWPERVATDSLFNAYDVHVLALSRQDSAQCVAREDRVRAIIGWLTRGSIQYRKILFVATDVRHAIDIDIALSRAGAEQRQRVLRVFLFQTPAADRALRSLPESCSVAVSREPQTVCSTFDGKRLADVPLATSVCDTILFAQMPPGMAAAAPCADALYPIFRDGLAATAYEADHVLPRFGVDQH